MPAHFRAVIMGSERSYLSVGDMQDAVVFCLDSSSHEKQTNYKVTFPNVFINNAC